MYLLKYFWYIVEHKWNVFKCAMKRGLYLHAFTHDLSKLLPSEFFGYAKYFYLDKEKYSSEFESACAHHLRRNPHHWQHWQKENGIPLDMPEKYIEQMVVDWEAMSLKFGGTAKDYYQESRDEDKIWLTFKTREKVEELLNVNPLD